MNNPAFEARLIMRGTPESERADLRTGFGMLGQLGWPEKFIDFELCKRVANGMVVPLYKGPHSYAEYKRMLHEEGNSQS